MLTGIQVTRSPPGGIYLAMSVFLDKRGRWVCDWRTLTGQRHRKVFTDHRSATDADHQIRARLSIQRRAKHIASSYLPKPLGAALTEYSAFRTKPPRDMRLVLRQFGIHVGGGNTDLHNITADHVRSFAHTLHERGLTQGTIWSYMRKLATFFNWCVAQDFIPKPPHRGAITIRKPGPSMHLITSDQLDQLLKAASPMLRRGILLAADCGLRLGEVAQATTLDVADHFLHVRPLKNGLVHAVWMSPRLRRALNKPVSKASHRHQPGQEQRLVPMSKDHLRLQYYRLVKRVGLAPLRFHDLRHFFATALARQGEPVQVIQKALGHRHASSALHYTHIGAVEVTRALMKLHHIEAPPRTRRRRKAA